MMARVFSFALLAHADRAARAFAMVLAATGEPRLVPLISSRLVAFADVSASITPCKCLGRRSNSVPLIW